MGLNREQIKLKIADAIENRIGPKDSSARVRYIFYLKPDICPEIHCGWAKIVRPQPYHKVIYTTMKNLDKGFTAEEWDTVAEHFLPYFQEVNSEL